MGREARCKARWPGGAGEVTALLETHELILRGDYKVRWPIESLTAEADGEWLILTSAEGEFALQLGPAASASWAHKIAIPPPTLADKLGVGPHARVLVIGEVEDPVLEEALATGLAPSPGNAHMALAVVQSAADLERALAGHQVLPVDAPIWVLNIKGKQSPFNEDAVRGIMRAAGFIDSKTASVSPELTATRYARRKG